MPRALTAGLLLLALSGCGTVAPAERMARAVERALLRHGYRVEPAETCGDIHIITGRNSETVSIQIWPGPDGDVEVRFGSKIELTRACEIEAWIFQEMNSLPIRR